MTYIVSAFVVAAFLFIIDFMWKEKPDNTVKPNEYNKQEHKFFEGKMN